MNATDTARPITVYSASAGSGKTFTLAARYVAQLLNAGPDEYKHILAVTFTVKATGEMKDRILGTLYNIAHYDTLPDALRSITDDYLDKIAQIQRGYEGRQLSSQEFAQKVRFSETERKEKSRRAQEVLKAILQNYDRFKVTTIDSFFQGVLKGVAHDLGLPANLRTEIGDEEVRNLAVERMMEDLHKEELADVKKLVWNFVGDKMDDDQKWSVSSTLKQFSEWLFKEEFVRYRDALASLLKANPNAIDELRKALQSQKQKAVDEVESLRENFEEASATWDLEDKDYLCGRDRNNSLKKIRNAMGAMGDMAPIKLEKNLDKFYADAVFMLKDFDGADESKKSVARAAHELFRSTYDAYCGCLFNYNGAQLVLANLHQLGLIGHIDRMVNEINNEKDQFMLANTGTLLGELMGQGGNSDFVFEKVGPRLNHVMIDEFQDTSRQQWENFRPLIEELAAAGNKSLIVGDIKQSLYRWRNGDWTALKNIATTFHGMVDSISLSDNFRSEREIIEFNNAVFPLIASQLDETADFGDNLISDIYTGVGQNLPEHKREKPSEGLVRVRIYEKKVDDAERYEDLCSQVAKLHRQGVPYGKMAIIVRTKSVSSEIIETFASHPETQEVRLVSGDAFMLQSSWAVQSLVAVLRYLYNNDMLAETYLSRLPDGDRPDLEALTYLKNLPLLEINERLISILHLGRHSDQAEYLMTYLDAVQDFVHNNASDLGAFLEYWDGKLYKTAITSTDKGALQIVTIHASKGLAFDHVFVPRCDFPLSKFFYGDIHWVSTQDKGTPYNQLPVLPVSFHATTMVNQSPFAQELKEELRQQLIDAANLLYVAFTRAKKSLYVWGQRSNGMSANATAATPLALALESMGGGERDGNVTTYIFGNENRTLSPKAAGVQNRMEPEFRMVTECSLVRPDYHPEFRQSSDSRRFLGSEHDQQVGDLIVEGSQFHKILSFMKKADDLDNAIARFRSEEVLDAEAEKVLRQIVANGMRRDDVADWFSGRYQVYNEQTLIVGDSVEGLDTHTPRPDRVMVAPDGVVVADYKFGRMASVHKHPKQHQKYCTQVRAYMTVLARMFPQRQVRGYLWYLRDNQVEEVQG